MKKVESIKRENREYVIKIVVTFRFEATHSWPECPLPEVKFLKNEHRHVFHVKALKTVTHDDRDVEIIMLKRKMESYVNGLLDFEGSIGRTSCEQLAKNLIDKFNLYGCEVLEDGENGAVVYAVEEQDEE